MACTYMYMYYAEYIISQDLEMVRLNLLFLVSKYLTYNNFACVSQIIHEASI